LIKREIQPVAIAVPPPGQSVERLLRPKRSLDSGAERVARSLKATTPPGAAGSRRPASCGLPRGAEPRRLQIVRSWSRYVEHEHHARLIARHRNTSDAVQADQQRRHAQQKEQRGTCRTAQAHVRRPRAITEVGKAHA